MTEQPDTAAIRAEYSLLRDETDALVHVLCDALDAARTELERERVMHRGIDPEKARYSRWWRKEKARTEAAEARIAELEQLADPELDARWCAVWQEVCAENDVLEARIAAAEENLTFAQQRAADNGLRAEIGEGKIRELVNEVHALKARIDAALEVLAEEPDWNQGRNAEVIFFGRDVFEALTGQ